MNGWRNLVYVQSSCKEWNAIWQKHGWNLDIIIVSDRFRQMLQCDVNVVNLTGSRLLGDFCEGFYLEVLSSGCACEHTLTRVQVGEPILVSWMKWEGEASWLSTHHCLPPDQMQRDSHFKPLPSWRSSYDLTAPLLLTQVIFPFLSCFC